MLVGLLYTIINKADPFSPTKTSKYEGESLDSISLVHFIVLLNLLIRFKNIWWSFIPCFPLTRVSSTCPNHNEVFHSSLSLSNWSKSPCAWKWYCSLARLEMHCRIFCFSFSDVCGLFLYIFSLKLPTPPSDSHKLCDHQRIRAELHGSNCYTCHSPMLFKPTVTFANLQHTKFEIGA